LRSATAKRLKADIGIDLNELPLFAGYSHSQGLLPARSGLSTSEFCGPHGFSLRSGEMMGWVRRFDHAKPILFALILGAGVLQYS
jgi:hypothetical protein